MAQSYGTDAGQKKILIYLQKYRLWLKHGKSQSRSRLVCVP